MATLNNLNRGEVATLAPGAAVADSVRLQKLLLDELGITRLQCVAGPSMGGMQALTWAVQYPGMVANCVAAITAPVCPPYCGLVPLEACIRAVEADPVDGLAHAVLIMTTGARTPQWIARAMLGNAYLEQMWDVARTIAARLDRERYLHMARSWQNFDLSAGYPDRRTALQRIQSRVLLLPVSTDLFFPPELSEELAAELGLLGKDAACVVTANHGGHQAGVAECGVLADPIRVFLSRG